MYTINNKFELGEECWSTYREKQYINVQFAMVKQRLFIRDIEFHVLLVMERDLKKVQNMH